MYVVANTNAAILGALRHQQHSSRYLRIFPSAHLRHHPTILQPGNGWLQGSRFYFWKNLGNRKNRGEVGRTSHSL